jgi:WD40 repeat protein
LLENSQRRDNYESQMRRIATLLRIQGRPEIDFLQVTEKQHEGSCEWLTRSDQFHKWIDFEDTLTSKVSHETPDSNARLLWLNGPPGSGKSVAAGHVVKYLQAGNFDCSFYFLRQSDKEKAVLSELLKSLAFQMAESSARVRRSLVEMLETEGPIKSHDHTMIWNAIFKNRIFRYELPRPQFWVLDALDECSSGSQLSLMTLLTEAVQITPLRIFLTSRPGGQTQTFLHRQAFSFLELRTGYKESLVDITAFVKARWPYSDGDTFNNKLLAEVVRKSNGIFLWASLIMDRLEETYSIEDMEDTLHKVPSEMNDFYSKIFQAITQSPGAELAKCILKWVVCAARSLTMEELRTAVYMDVDKTLAVSGDKLSSLCGHLVTVDREGRLQLIHQTVASFLAQQETDIQVNIASSHSRLAEICLRHLNGKELAPPRSRRLTKPRKFATPFTDYASTYFSFHLAHSLSSMDGPLSLLHTFIATNSLSWIELVASTGSLITLRSTVQYLQTYLVKREKSSSQLGDSFSLATSWINDVARITGRFGPNLLDSPTSIYFLIPLLCPPTSIVYRMFAKSSRQLKLIGYSEQGWDDRLSCLAFATNVLSLASGEHTIAVGLSSGNIIIYNGITFEVMSTLLHGEKVRHLTYGNVSALLAACGLRKVSLWSASLACVWSSTLYDIPLTLSFNSDDSEMQLPLRRGSIYVLQTKTGDHLEDVLLQTFSDSDSDEDSPMTRSTPPSIIRLSAARRLAAVAYRNSPITLLDLESVGKFGVFEKEGCEGVYVSPQVLDIVFNPISELDLMAIAYDNCDIVICDPWTLEQRAVYNILAFNLASSPDGRVLAASDANNTICLFLFRSLQLIYRIEAIEDRILNLTFDSIGTRLLDIRDTCCNVWEPTILMKGCISDGTFSEPQDEAGQKDSTSTVTRIFNDDEISVIECSFDAEYIFSGREDGLIAIHDVSTGKVIKQFRFHTKTVGIRHLKWSSEHGILVSVDYAGRCIVTRLSPPPKGQWQHTDCLIDIHTRKSIHHILLSPTASALLIITAQEAELLALDGTLVATQPYSKADSTWLNHPTDATQLILAGENSIQCFNWDSLTFIESLITADALHQTDLSSPDTPVHRTWLTYPGYNPLIRLSWSKTRDLELVLLDPQLCAAIGRSNATATIMTKKLLSHVKVPIGLVKSLLYFLDTQGWICSISLKSVIDVKHYTRHFFIPLAWQTGTKVSLSIISQGSMAFVHHDQLMVFHGFLEFEEKVFFEETAK